MRKNQMTTYIFMHPNFAEIIEALSTQYGVDSCKKNLAMKFNALLQLLSIRDTIYFSDDKELLFFLNLMAETRRVKLYVSHTEKVLELKKNTENCQVPFVEYIRMLLLSNYFVKRENYKYELKLNEIWNAFALKVYGFRSSTVAYVDDDIYDSLYHKYKYLPMAKIVQCSFLLTYIKGNDSMEQILESFNKNPKNKKNKKAVKLMVEPEDNYLDRMLEQFDTTKSNLVAASLINYEKFVEENKVG